MAAWFTHSVTTLESANSGWGTFKSFRKPYSYIYVYIHIHTFMSIHTHTLNLFSSPQNKMKTQPFYMFCILLIFHKGSIHYLYFIDTEHASLTCICPLKMHLQQRQIEYSHLLPSERDGFLFLPSEGKFAHWRALKESLTCKAKDFLHYCPSYSYFFFIVWAVPWRT